MIQNDHKSPNLTIRDGEIVAQWCQTRCCRARYAAAHHAAIILESLSHRSSWRSLTLTKRHNLYRLADEWGEALAEASSLSAVLDALDGGVASASLAIALPLPAALAVRSFLFV